VVSIEDFSKLDLRVGRVMNVEDIEKARRPVYKLTIDFGAEVGMRTIVAGIKDVYPKEGLINRQIVCIVNLDPKTVAGVESQGMILAAEDENGIAILVPEKELANGSKIH
jgi:export-related chaperone CsaA